MRRTVIILIGLALSAAGASAQRARRNGRVASPRAAVAAALTAREVLDRYVSAVGGRAAVGKITSRVSKGSLEIPSFAGAKGTFEVYEKAPNREVTILNLPGLGTQSDGFDGVTAWTQDIESGVTREKSGVELAAAMRSADFYEEMHLQEVFPRMILKGVRVVDGRRAYVLEGAPAVGRPETFYFDTVTGLLVRRDSVDEGPEGTQPVEEFYGDYREVDGVKIPFLVRQSTQGNLFVIRLSEVRHNVRIDDARFHRPEEQ